MANSRGIDVALKLAISGKGGVGKSTLAGTIARLFAADGWRVLAIDADPDANLASALGLPADLRREVRTISKERELLEERTGAKPGEFGQVFSLNPDVSGIAEQYGVHHAGVDLLVVGGVSRPGGGCACPESVLIKSLVRHLVLAPQGGEVVIMDMEAGIEHLGRSTAVGVDLMLAVVEPGRCSVETAHRIREMSAGIGIRDFAVVVNKSVDPEGDLEWMAGEFGQRSVIGLVPFDRRIADAERAGMSIVDLGCDDLMAPFRKLQHALCERFADGPVGGVSNGERGGESSRLESPPTEEGRMR
jgi:CO dehydrogenase maturation factor